MEKQKDYNVQCIWGGFFSQLMLINIFFLSKWLREISVLKDFYFYFSVVCVWCLCVINCTCACRCSRGPEEGSKSPGIGVEVAVSCPMRVPGTKFRSSARAVFALNCWAVSPASILEHCIAVYKQLLPSAGPRSLFRALQQLVIRKKTSDECPSATSLHSLEYSSGLGSRGTEHKRWCWS